MKIRCICVPTGPMHHTVWEDRAPAVDVAGQHEGRQRALLRRWVESALVDSKDMDPKDICSRKVIQIAARCKTEGEELDWDRDDGGKGPVTTVNSACFKGRAAMAITYIEHQKWSIECRRVGDSV